MNGNQYPDPYQQYPGCHHASMPGYFRRQPHLMQWDVPINDYLFYAPHLYSYSAVPAVKTIMGAAGYNSEQVKIDGRTPDEWIKYTEYLVNEGLEDVKRGINATHILQEFILMGVLVGKGYSPDKAYETVEEWERTGVSKILQQSKNMQ